MQSAGLKITEDQSGAVDVRSIFYRVTRAQDFFTARDVGTS